MLFSKILLLVALVFTTYVSAAPNMCTVISDCGKQQYCGNLGFCVECLSDNDCGLNEYCSGDIYDSGRYGKCQKFSKAGDDCVSSTRNALTDVTTRNDTKCAETYFNYAGTYPNQLSVDYQGVCIAGKCRMCNYADSSVDSTEGTGLPRTCVFPGTWATPHSAQWKGGKYFENPLNVWLAILFCLIVLILTFHVIGFVSK